MPATKSSSAASFHSIPLAKILESLDTSRKNGLSAADAAQRLATHGPNELQESGGRGLPHIIWEQVSSTMILVLVVAGFLAWFLKGGGGLPIDAIAIFSIVILFVVLGVMQEYRAQKAISALKKMSSPKVRVIRDGQVIEISARDLVAGDLVQMETGVVVPADCRIVENYNLRVQEAALTGESEAVEKTSADIANAEAALGDRKNMLFSGTHVTYGRGTAVVVATGMQTELGKIASLLQSVRHELTPLQKRLDRLGKTLAILAVIVAILVGITGLAEGKTIPEILILAVSIAVAIIPEGLPAVLTFTLAIGAQRMLRRKALIRKLPAVETLGSVTVVCSDKTGTLTMNRMTVTRLATLSESASFAGTATGDHLRLLEAAVLCSDATLGADGKTGVGDPTEIALVAALAASGVQKAQSESAQPRVHEFAFDSDRKRMTTIHQTPAGEIFAVTKGAADQMLQACTSVQDGKNIVAFTDEMRLRFEQINSGLAHEGIRVLGVAQRALTAVPESTDPSCVECEMTFLGLIGMIDPPRPEAKAAVARCHTAGIQVKMITGDHPETALTIAKDLGIAREGSKVISGVELERMTIAQIREIVGQTSVFARVSPEHKLKIVQALQENGEVVAMTGDGVNDAPALKRADIGIAMGITGTDVAKEAADMVLVDDNFATIVNAVEEGRVVFDNLRRFIMFSLAGNIAKVLVVALPPLMGMMAMLKPIQILFSNLLTDGLLGLGIGMEAAEKNVMSRPPYSPKESIFSRGVGLHVALVGPIIGLLFIAFGAWQWDAMNLTAALAEDPSRGGAGFLMWGTLMFTALAFMQIVRVFSSRSFTEPFWKNPLLNNPVLLGMSVLAILLQLTAILAAPLHSFFHTTALTLQYFGMAIAVAILVLVIMEGLKTFTKRFN